MDTDLLSREVSNKIFILHVVKCVLQLLGGYVSTNLSNSLTKFFDSVMCVSKNKQNNIYDVLLFSRI
jgi:hypothetical protein